jgi:hypothetical protein
MQQVEGSSPFSRFGKPRSGGVFSWPPGDRRPARRPPGRPGRPSQDLLRAAKATPKIARIARGATRNPMKKAANPSSVSSRMPTVAKVLPACGRSPARALSPFSPGGVSWPAGLLRLIDVGRP